MKWAGWRRVRQAVQVLSLGVFVYLLYAALQRQTALPLADLFFRLDPLPGLAAMVTARTWLPRLALGLVTLGLTLVVGRVWCGWLCPMGTVLEWARFTGAAKRQARISPRWRLAKNLLLLVIAAGALVGSLTLLVLDPLTLLTRSLTVAVLPALDHAITAIETTLYTVGPLQPVVDAMEQSLRGPVLPVEQPAFAQNITLLLLLGGILALNALADRFWCRYLCPLGALLGYLSRFSLLRPVLNTSCRRCARCERACRLGAIDAQKGYSIQASECTVCLDCLTVCPQETAGFRLRPSLEPWREYDPSRRQFLGALVAGAAGAAVLRTGVQARVRPTQLMRPPGVEDEASFLSRCVRCSECMKVCPTNALQPSVLDAGLEGLWTPHLVPRIGYCDYGCNACGQICPTGAIPALDLAAKRQAVIGLAAVDHNRCLPWAYSVPCIVCQEMCPVPEKAIKLDVLTLADGTKLPRPVVREDLCIGCGICEHQCPASGQAAIRVYSK